MNKRIPLILIAGIALAGCAKTNLLYDDNAYNYPEFDRNYYTDWDDIKELSIENEKIADLFQFYVSDKTVSVNGKKVDNFVWYDSSVEKREETEFGYNNNLSKIEKKFCYGITSKLFDGRVRCEGLYQKSRVQLDKTGFAMYFPKTLISANYLALACRGGTNLYETNGENFSHNDLLISFTWAFYIHKDNNQYDKVIYQRSSVPVPVDNSGNTTFISFTPNAKDINQAVAMSFEWSCDDPRLASKNIADDYQDKEKNHLSLMMYEMFIGDSVWN